MKDGYLFLYAIDDSRRGGDFYPLGDQYELIPMPPNFSETIQPSRVYAHQLDTAKQKDKFFALEAMNDVRIDYAINHLKTGSKWHTIKNISIKALRGIIKNLLDIDKSYLRRVVKANELFFVFKINEIYDDNVREKIAGRQ